MGLLVKFLFCGSVVYWFHIELDPILIEMYPADEMYTVQYERPNCMHGIYKASRSLRNSPDSVNYYALLLVAS